MTVIVKVHNGYFYAGKEHVPVDGQVAVILARNGASYELVQQLNGKAPQKVKVEKKKDDLLISVDGDDAEDIIIQGFFLYPESQLVGLGEDGSYYSYLPDESEFDTLFGDTLNPRSWYDKYFGDTDASATAHQGMQSVGLYSYGKTTPWLLDAKTEPMGDLLLPVLGGIGLSGLVLLAVENSSKDNIEQPIPDAPARPTAEINDDGTEVTGTGDAGSTVRVFGSSGELGTATVGTDGKYTVTLSTSQKNGETLRVNAVKDGSAASSSATVTAPDTTAPEKAESAEINDAGTQVTGKAEPGAKVNVLDEYDNVIGAGQVQRDGSYTVNLRVAQTAEQALKVQVVDAKDNKSETIDLKGAKGENSVVTKPIDVDLSSNAVDENAEVGSTVGVTVKSSDYEKVTYVLVNDAGGKFAIDANTGVVTLAAAVDYETAARYTIIARATSEDGTFRETSFSISINNINDNSISGITDANSTANQVTSNATEGTAVGITARAVDADRGDTVTYSLTNSADGKFSINADTGVIVVAGDLSSNGSSTLSITVKANSSDGSSSEQSFDITVLATSAKTIQFVDQSSETVNTNSQGSISTADMFVQDAQTMQPLVFDTLF